MFKSVLFVAFLGLTLSASALARVSRLNPDVARIIRTVNAANTTWTAGVNERYAYIKDMKQFKRYLGALEEPAEVRLPETRHEVRLSAIPEEFDARTAWGERCPSVKEVRDQSSCGSCWAFGAVEAATDRICIATNGEKRPHLSATDMLSCCWTCGFGCNGGYPSSAWSWLKSSGSVTGGNYGDNDWCSAYPYKQCDHHVEGGKYGPCDDLPEYPTPQCPTSCDAGSNYNVTFSNDKYKFASAYSVANNVAQIQTEIMTYGPVEAAFTVYSDFPTYKSGVYKHTTGSALGGHAIKMLGWGVEDGTPYWLIANSWNEGWGDNGYFKILRGSNHCGIEGGVVAGKFTA